MYFGPLPAIFRLPIVAATDLLDGRLSAGFMVIVFALTLAAVGVLVWRVRRLVRPDQPVGRTETAVVALFVVLVGIGSPLFFTGSRSWVYHEAARAMAFAVCVVPPDRGPPRRPHPGATHCCSVLTGASALEPRSIGAGPIAALGIVLLVVLVVQIRPGVGVPAWLGRARTAARAGVAPGYRARVAIPIVIFAADNTAKSGTPFSIPFDTQLQNLFDANGGVCSRRTAGRGHSGSDSHPAPPARASRRHPVLRDLPLGRLPDARPTVIGDLLFDQRDYTVGITAPCHCSWPSPSPASSARSAAGHWPSCGYRSWACGAPPISLSFLYVAKRYVGDLLPLVVLGAVAGLPVTLSALDGRSRAVRRGAFVVFSALVVLGVWTGIALVVEYQRNLTPLVPTRSGRSTCAGSPTSQRSSAAAHARWAAAPSSREPGPRDALFVVGAARASTHPTATCGGASNAPRRPGTSAYRPPSPAGRGTVEPLVTSGTGPARWAGGPVPARWDVWCSLCPGAAFGGRRSTSSPDAAAIDVVLDRHLDEMQVSRDGVRVFRDDYDGTSDRFTVGVDPDDPARRFSGALTRFVRLELCGTVVDRSP